MKICNVVGTYRLNTGNLYKKNSSNTQSKSRISNLPNPKQYDYMPMETAPHVAQRLQKEYRKNLEETFFDKKGCLRPDIKKFLDTQVFTFELQDGTKSQTTIKDRVKKIMAQKRPVDTTLYHSTATKEEARKIIANGFNPNYIKRVEHGPGFYFASSASEARKYNPVILSARCRGYCAIPENSSYSQVRTNEVVNKLKEFTGLKSNGYPTELIEASFLDHIVNEHVRNIMLELGYEMSLGANCYVVYSNKAISDIEISE